MDNKQMEELEPEYSEWVEMLYQMSLERQDDAWREGKEH